MMGGTRSSSTSDAAAVSRKTRTAGANTREQGGRRSPVPKAGPAANRALGPVGGREASSAPAKGRRREPAGSVRRPSSAGSKTSSRAERSPAAVAVPEARPSSPRPILRGRPRRVPRSRKSVGSETGQEFGDLSGQPRFPDRGQRAAYAQVHRRLDRRCRDPCPWRRGCRGHRPSRSRGSGSPSWA